MPSLESLISSFAVLWAAIDPIGTLPIYLAVTKGYNKSEQKRIARSAVITAFFILLFFLVVGEVLLRYVGVPLAAFQTSGGIILFLFAINMIFGDSKPEEELNLLKKSPAETAIFPLAMPSIASPGAILAIVLLTDNSRHSFIDQGATAAVMSIVLLITYSVMAFSKTIHSKIGNAGAIVVSKVMGMILASIAANSVLAGLKEYFNL
jgi:multiple antibiotic resistance protein